MMVVIRTWGRVTVVGPDGAPLGFYLLEGAGAPDLGVVDDVARLALLAARQGGCIVLEEVSPAMGELLELAGLVVEVERQTELRKQLLGLQERQEEAHPDDLSP
jgi:hypothetical protein